MKRALTSCLDRLCGISSTSEYDLATYRERLDALKGQLPWLHGIMAFHILGVQFVASRETRASFWPALAMLLFIALRATHWSRLRRSRLLRPFPQNDLRQTVLVTAFFFTNNAIWCGYLYSSASTGSRIDIAIISGLAALGASCGLSSFPAAARIPLVVLALPSGAALSFLKADTHAAIGVCIIILTAIHLQLLRVRDASFARLVSSRTALEAEKKRAIEAENAALTEKSRVTSLANTDPLTGLANRRGFMSSIDDRARCDKRRLGLILVDLDGFKPINDTFGHHAGDAMLVEVGRRLKSLSSVDFPVARLGGDEFAMTFECKSTAEAVAIAEQALAALVRPFNLLGREMRISACIGVSCEGSEGIDEAIRRADIALFDAKRRGRGAVAIFSDEMRHEVQRRTSIEQALREPTLLSEIDVSFQPIFALDTMQLTALEALARWQHPDLGWVSPSEFIPITEQISVVHEVSYELLKRAAIAARDWPASVRLSFNLSAIQLCTEGAAARVLETIAAEDLSPDRLQIEVTETAFLTDFDLARRNLAELRANRVSIVLDDFGAGYSSIAYLREMSFDAVKLDGSLISSMHCCRKGLDLLEGVLALCRAMGQQCVAEHIENQKQIDTLRRLGCRFGQGFALSRPLSAADAARLAASKLVKMRSSRPRERRAAA